MTCEDREDNIYLHAAGALEHPELADLQRHLATGCPNCSGVLAAAHATLAQYTLALKAPAVPTSAKAALDRRINESPEESVGAAERERLMIRPERSGVRWGQVLLAACLAAALTAGPVYFQQSARNTLLETNVMSAKANVKSAEERFAKSDSERAANATRLASAEKTLESIQAALTAAQSQNTELLAKNKDLTNDLSLVKTDLAATQQVAQMLASKQLLMVDLKGQAGNPDAHSRLLVDLEHKIWRLYTADLKPVPNRVFEFWLITADGAKVPMGSFTTDAAGHGVLAGTVPDPLPALAQAAITDEPAPGQKVPTGSVHTAGKFQ